MVYSPRVPELPIGRYAHIFSTKQLNGSAVFECERDIRLQIMLCCTVAKFELYLLDT